MSKIILVYAAAGAVSGLIGWGLAKIPRMPPGLSKFLAIVVAVCLVMLARTALSEEHSAFVGRWDGTVGVSGTCVTGGENDNPSSKTFSGYVIIEAGEGDALLLLSRQFPSGIRFTVRHADKGVYVEAVPGQSTPWAQSPVKPRVPNESGTVTVESGWIAVRQGSLTAHVVSATHVVKENLLLPNRVTDCTLALDYAMRRPFGQEGEAVAEAPPPATKAPPVDGAALWQSMEARAQADYSAARASGRVHRLTFKGTTHGFNHGFLAIRSFGDCAVHYVGAPVTDSDDHIRKMLEDFGGACSGDDCGTNNSLNVRVVVDAEARPDGVTLEHAVTVSPIARKGTADAACLKNLGDRTVEGVITAFDAGNSSGEFSIRLKSGQSMDFDFSWSAAPTVNGSRSWVQQGQNPWVLGQTPVTVVYKTIAERTGKVSVEPVAITTH